MGEWIKPALGRPRRTTAPRDRARCRQRPSPRSASGSGSACVGRHQVASATASRAAGRSCGAAASAAQARPSDQRSSVWRGVSRNSAARRSARGREAAGGRRGRPKAAPNVWKWRKSDLLSLTPRLMEGYLDGSKWRVVNRSLTRLTPPAPAATPRADEAKSGRIRSAIARQDPDRRFRLAGDAAHRAPRARGEGLLRDRAVPEGGGGLRGDAAQGRDPVRRPGLGARARTRRSAPEAIFDAGVPVLGICYGEQAMAQQLGGKVEGGHHREFGRAEVEVTEDSAAVRGRLEEGREISGLDEPRRPRHRIAGGLPRRSATAPNSPIAMIGDEARKFYAMQFHLEVDAHAAWRGAPAQFRAQDRRRVRRLDHARLQGRGDRENPRAGRQGQGDLRPVRRRRFGGGGGADPRGDRRAAHLRVRRSRPAAARPKPRRSSTLFRDHYNIPLVHVNAVGHVPRRRSTASPTPSRSARPSANCSSTCSRPRRRRSAAREFLAQGTLYPDVIESVSFTGGPSVTIKSHHNVGGLPERMNMKLVEPLRELFKDEVRALGRELGLPEAFVGRHPFPGPGLAIRIPGAITQREVRHPAARRRNLHRGNPPRRSLRRHLAGLRRAAAGARPSA